MLITSLFGFLRKNLNLFYWLPQSWLKKFELFARLGQGKGWGSSTISAEVKAAVSLMPMKQLGQIIAIDVGANVGNWTEELVRIYSNAVVVAVEPSTEAFLELSTKFQNNENISTCKTAVGSKSEKRNLYSDFPGSGLASLSNRNLEHFGIEFTHSEPVEIVTLDSISENMNVKPNLLKIDVEGHEMAVLEGALEVLTSVEVVQFEFGGCNIDTKTFFQDFFYFFRNRNFALFRLGPRGLIAIDSYNEIDEAFQTTNFFAKKLQ